MGGSDLRLLCCVLLAVSSDAAAVRQSPFGEYAPQINSWLDRQLAKQVADLSVPVAQLDASLGIHGPPASDLPPQRGDLANAEPPPRPRRRRRGRRRAPPAGGLVELWPNASAVADAPAAAVPTPASAGAAHPPPSTQRWWTPNSSSLFVFHRYE